MTTATASTFWDKIARKYAAQPVRDPSAYETTLARTRAYLHANDTVLELGCGTGTTALTLAGDVAQVVASDFSPEMTRIGAEKAAAQGIENVQFVTGAAGSELAPDGPLDAVLAFNLLHLLPDLDTTLTQVQSSLKPGGYFISKTVCLAEKSWTLRVLVSLVRAFMALRHRCPPPHVAFLKIGELEARLKASGFEILETGDYPASPPNHFVVARKT